MNIKIRLLKMLFTRNCLCIFDAIQKVWRFDKFDKPPKIVLLCEYHFYNTTLPPTINSFSG